MLAIVALAVDDARWAGYGVGEGSQTAFLVWAVLFGGLWGFVSAKSDLSTLGAHMLGAFIATLFLLIAVSGVLSADRSLDGRLQDLQASMTRFSYDLFVQGVRSAETSAFLLVIGAVAWTTGQFAAFNLFRRHRPVAAIIAVGTMLLVNISVTVQAQYLYLVTFSAGALILLVRMNMFQRREGWVQRRIGDAGYVSGLFVRSGVAFVVVTLLGSLMLTATASSAPMAGAWRNVDDQLIRVGGAINHFVGGVSGAAKGPGGLFSPTQTIRGVWESSDAIVFRVASSDTAGYYWRAATYDYFDGITWQQRGRGDGVRVAPGDRLLEPTREEVAEGSGRRPVDVTITAVDYNSDLVLAPEAPLSADQPIDVYTNDPGGAFAAMQLPGLLRDGDSYTVRSLVRSDAGGNQGLTGNELAAAGIVYPEWTRRFIEIPEGSIGELTYQTADEIVAELPPDERTPYHIATAVQRYLYSEGGFQYRTDVRGLCGSQKLVDCFLTAKVGYCEYFATAMVMLLRTQQIPARMAMGYLPGRQLPDDSWEVDRGAAHAWVEVYFPGHGWVRFDPTPGNQENGQEPTLLPGGPAVDATPEPSDPITRPSFITPDPRDDDALGALDRSEGPLPPQLGGGGGTGYPGPAQPLILLALATLVIVAASLGMWARSRRLSNPPPDFAYRGMARLAGRLGYGPRPAETVYEYAGALGELVPDIRAELQVVADAKVRAAYAPQPALEGLAAVRAAYRRVRVSLLRLALRKPRRRPR